MVRFYWGRCQHENNGVKVAQPPLLFFSLTFPWHNLKEPFYSGVITPAFQFPPHISPSSRGVFQLYMWSEIFLLCLALQKAWVWDGRGCCSHGNDCSHHRTFFGVSGATMGSRGWQQGEVGEPVAWNLPGEKGNKPGGWAQWYHRNNCVSSKAGGSWSWQKVSVQVLRREELALFVPKQDSQDEGWVTSAKLHREA